MRQQAFAHSGPARQFINGNWTGPDPVNGFGRAGGVLVLSGTSFSITLAPSTPPSAYQVRVIGLSPTRQPIDTLSDAVTVVVE
jgi:hypothetical protein